MKFQKDKENNKLILTAEETELEILEDYKENELLHTPEAESEIMENFIGNSDFEYIDPADISALTEAPIIGIKNENDDIEVYVWDQYQIISMAQGFDEYNGIIELEFVGSIFNSLNI